MSTLSLVPLKNILPIDPLDTTHDIRLGQLLTLAEESLSAPNGMTRFIIGTSRITYYPKVPYSPTTNVEIKIEYTPITTIDKVYYISDSNQEVDIPHTLEYRGEDTTVNIASIPSALIDGTKNLPILINLTGGLTEDTIQPKLRFIAYQLAAIKFFNPDPTKQEIPSFLMNEINRL